MKKCSKCKNIKELTEFCKDKNREDGLFPQCKECCKGRRLAYKKTKEGLVAKIYSSQCGSSKQRGHNQPTYTQSELQEWIYSQKKFHVLYDNWKRLDYQSRYKPSVDRKDDYIGYTISNIQLMTWQENMSKWHNRNKRKVTT